MEKLNFIDAVKSNLEFNGFAPLVKEVDVNEEQTKAEILFKKYIRKSLLKGLMSSLEDYFRPCTVGLTYDMSNRSYIIINLKQKQLNLA